MTNIIPNTPNHTHWQDAQSLPASQNLPKSMAAPTQGRRKSTGIQHCIRAIAGKGGKIKVCTFNKLWWWRTGNRLEIRYCSYT